MIFEFIAGIMLSSSIAVLGWSAIERLRVKEEKKEETFVVEKSVFKKVMSFFDNVQSGKVSFTPYRALKDNYFDNHIAGNVESVALKLFSVTGESHTCSVYVENERILTFDFYPTGEIKNLFFHLGFVTEETSAAFSASLQKAMKMYMAQKGKKEVFKKELFVENKKEPKVLEDFLSLFKEEKALAASLLEVLALKEEILEKDIEDFELKHDFETLLERRVFSLLLNFYQMDEETKKQKREVLLEAMDVSKRKLEEIKEKNHAPFAFEFEKQVQLIKR